MGKREGRLDEYMQIVLLCPFATYLCSTYYTFGHEGRGGACVVIDSVSYEAVGCHVAKRTRRQHGQTECQDSTDTQGPVKVRCSIFYLFFCGFWCSRFFIYFFLPFINLLKMCAWKLVNNISQSQRARFKLREYVSHSFISFHY